jgi:four helix bundle protein
VYLHSFEKLNVWQESIDLVELIYEATNKFPSEEKFGIISQMRRSSISISSNIAEGTSRVTNKDKAHFSTLAFSSTMELLCQIIISKRLNYISEDEYLLFREKTLKISNMINALKKAQLND